MSPRLIAAGRATAPGVSSAPGVSAASADPRSADVAAASGTPPTGTSPPRLALEGVTFAYGSVPVLHAVDLAVPALGVVALLGTNGAGKSTILRVISGLERPRSGRVLLDGKDITGLDAKARVEAGVVQVPGGKAMFGSLPVYDNLVLGAWPRRRNPALVAQRLARVLDTFPELEPMLHRPARLLSGGQQQMVAIGRALLAEPRVLLIDELSLGLAPVVVGRMIEVVRRIRDDGVAVVVVEQSLNVALEVADHAYFLERGTVRFDGPAAALANRPDLLRSVFLGGAGDESDPEPAVGAPT